MDERLAELNKVIKEREMRLNIARGSLAEFRNEMYALEMDIDSVEQTLKGRYNAALAETNRQNKVKLAELETTIINAEKAVNHLDNKVREAYLEYNLVKTGRPREAQFNSHVTVVPQPKGGRKSRKGRKSRGSRRSRRH